MRHCGGIMADCSGRRLAASWVWLLWVVFRDGLVRESALRWKNPRGGVGGLVWFCGPGVLVVIGGVVSLSQSAVHFARNGCFWLFLVEVVYGLSTSVCWRPSVLALWA